MHEMRNVREGGGKRKDRTEGGLNLKITCPSRDTVIF